jgi:hemerythrin
VSALAITRKDNQTEKHMTKHKLSDAQRLLHIESILDQEAAVDKTVTRGLLQQHFDVICMHIINNDNEALEALEGDLQVLREKIHTTLDTSGILYHY